MLLDPLSDRLGAAPRRIVSLVPSWTETLAALGLDREVVGLTDFCIHPAAWRRGPAAKARVGGTKTVDGAKVAALAPDLVMANREENVRDQVEALAAAFPVVLTDASTVEGALGELRGLGHLVHRADRAAALADALAAGLEAVPTTPVLQVAYFIWKDPWMTVGGDTYVHDALARTGFASVFGDRSRYPVVTPEDVAAARPDVLLFSSEPFRFRPKHVGEMAAACPEAAVRFVDGEAFSWYGAALARLPGEAARLRASLA